MPTADSKAKKWPPDPEPNKMAEALHDSSEDHYHHTTHGVRYFRLGEGYDLVGMRDEIDAYMEVLLGREDPPVNLGVITLMEVAEAYHARAREMEMELLELEAEGAVIRGSRPYKFRTGKLRSFIEMSAKTIELGSRRITWEKELHGRH